MENGIIKIFRSLGVRAAGGETKMVTVIKNWKMVESSVEKGPNVPENARKMVILQYRLTLRCFSSCTFMNRKVLEIEGQGVSMYNAKAAQFTLCFVDGT